jgi:glycosyltransferase involved in cell wall biosynthesis
MERSSNPIRVLFFCTSYHSTNGYSYVGYEIAKELGKRPDQIHLTVYGFQRFHSLPNHRTDYPSNVYEYDAFGNEKVKAHGFGIEEVVDFVTINKPDICIVYNDCSILQGVISKLIQVPDRKFKIMAYLDQVYLSQRPHYIHFLNQTCDAVMCFTPFWERNAVKIGITRPTSFLRHGFNKNYHYPIPKDLARRYFGLSMDDFIVFNANRNQPRKRWDTCMQAFALALSKLPPSCNMKLLIATAPVGGWNLHEVFHRELRKYDIPVERGMSHLILMPHPQNVSDEEILFMYNAADVGINSCDGAGFELINFQQGAIGIPQIVSYVGGLTDFFDETTAAIVRPKVSYYIDMSRDAVGGEAELCDYRDFADALIRYYNDRELMKEHGKRARTKITTEYAWEDICDRMVNIIEKTMDETYAYDCPKESIYTPQENLERAMRHKNVVETPSPEKSNVVAAATTPKEDDDDMDMVPLN